MEQSGNSSLIARLDDHVRGEHTGRNWFVESDEGADRDRENGLKAEKVDGGYIVNGCLPWVSHIRARRLLRGYNWCV